MFKTLLLLTLSSVFFSSNILCIDMVRDGKVGTKLRIPYHLEVYHSLEAIEGLIVDVSIDIDEPVTAIGGLRTDVTFTLPDFGIVCRGRGFGDGIVRGCKQKYEFIMQIIALPNQVLEETRFMLELKKSGEPKEWRGSIKNVSIITKELDAVNRSLAFRVIPVEPIRALQYEYIDHTYRECTKWSWGIVCDKWETKNFYEKDRHIIDLWMRKSIRVNWFYY